MRYACLLFVLLHHRAAISSVPAVVQPFTQKEHDATLRRRGEYSSTEIQTRCRRIALLCELGGNVAETVDKLADAHSRYIAQHRIY
jgi:hypothetical protein